MSERETPELPLGHEFKAYGHVSSLPDPRMARCWCGQPEAAHRPAEAAPGHTDLMVTPESLDAYLAAEEFEAIRAEAMELACRAVCCHCGRAPVARMPDRANNRPWSHNGEKRDYCGAWQIREAFQSEEKKG